MQLECRLRYFSICGLRGFVTRVPRFGVRGEKVRFARGRRTGGNVAGVVERARADWGAGGGGGEGGGPGGQSASALFPSVHTPAS